MKNSNHCLAPCVRTKSWRLTPCRDYAPDRDISKKTTAWTADGFCACGLAQRLPGAVLDNHSPLARTAASKAASRLKLLGWGVHDADHRDPCRRCGHLPPMQRCRSQRSRSIAVLRPPLVGRDRQLLSHSFISGASLGVRIGGLRRVRAGAACHSACCQAPLTQGLFDRLGLSGWHLDCCRGDPFLLVGVALPATGAAARPYTEGLA